MPLPRDQLADGQRTVGPHFLPDSEDGTEPPFDDGDDCADDVVIPGVVND